MLNKIADKISDSEAEIMKVIWENGGAVTYSHIRSVLCGQVGWESPTVNTLVNRLVKKGVLNQEKRDVYYYTPMITEDEYMDVKTKNFIQKVYSGNVKGLLSALISHENVTQEDLDSLKEYWEKGKSEE